MFVLLTLFAFKMSAFCLQRPNIYLYIYKRDKYNILNAKIFGEFKQNEQIYN